jgi:hypothetical protein
MLAAKERGWSELEVFALAWKKAQDSLHRVNKSGP